VVVGFKPSVSPSMGIPTAPRRASGHLSEPKASEDQRIRSGTVARSLRDVDAAVINTNYALAAKLNPLKDAIFLENSASPYANVLSTVPGKANDPRILALIKALQSATARQFIQQKYQGAVLPAF
jgi:D-methionine transport system substrate-binding protein